MLPNLSYQNEHNLWKQVIGHECNDAKKFVNKNYDYFYDKEQCANNLEKI